MALSVEDIEDPCRFRLIRKVPYEDLAGFVLDNLNRRSPLTLLFWSVCIVMLGIAVIVRINIAGYYQLRNIMFHSLLGFIVFPILIIPVHEVLHAIPFLFTGARKLRAGIDLKQYFFYVTAHRHVINSAQFGFVACTPFILINIVLLILILSLPGLWKWSLSLLLFVHTTMCAGDFALLNFFRINRKKNIFTWDDAYAKVAYFYEEI